MFTKAVKQHVPTQNLKGSSQSSLGPTKTLQPSAPTVLNASRPAWPTPKNPLKRTVSQAMGGYFSTESRKPSIRESSFARHDSGLSKNPIPELSQLPGDGGRVEKLHDAVFFDENDFVDDEDLDLDSDSPVNSTKTDSTYPSTKTDRTHPSIKTETPYSSVQTDITYPSTTTDRTYLSIKTEKTYPSIKTEKTYPSIKTEKTYPSIKTDTTYPSIKTEKIYPSTTTDVKYPSLPDTLAHTTTSPNPPTSSVPIPWSSSPPHHKLPVAETVAPAASTAPRASTGTRRPLPWLEEKSGERDEYQTCEANRALEQRTPNARVQRILEAQRRRKAANAGNSFTPLPKDEPESQFPWNKTASTVKKEQKVLRQGNKRLVRDVEPDAKAKVTSAKDKKVPQVFLSDEQRKVLTLVAEGKKSVFFTGSAGTGKSVLLRESIFALRKKFMREPDRVAVTASTGLAACNIEGVTLHSFAGIGLGKEAVPELVRKIKRNQKAKLRWLRTKVLIIDEISMVDGDLFDKLEAIARIVRNNGRPFGGIQLVITGDFFQLPPVPDHGQIAKFAFDAATWNTSIEHTIGLTQVFRQKDPDFANMLNEMRLGKLSNQSVNTFKSLNRELKFDDDIRPTELFPTRNEVEAANNTRMRNLVGKSYDFVAEDGGSIVDKAQRDKLLSNCMAPQKISLKKDAQVMLIKNIDDTLVNGSIGKVIGFMDEKMFELYDSNEEELQAVETMAMKFDDEQISESRKKLRAMACPDSEGNTSRQWPLVSFSLADGTYRQLLCQPESWKIELPSGEVQASRFQVPLILAWALSIHKAQGQTLERVKVDLGKIFEKGQAYVALSRATCQEGLQILRFDSKKVMAHDKVRGFYESLYSVEKAEATAIAPTTKKIKGETKSEEHLPVKVEWDDDEDALLEMFS